MADPGRPVAGARGAPGPLMSRGRGAAALLLIFVFFFLISNSPLNILDEGFVLYAAERILHGDLPYRDFQLHYMPAQFYVLAALFKAFGHSIFLERMWDAVVRTGVVAAGFALARNLMPPAPAAIAALLIMLRLGASGFHGINLFPALLFALLSGAWLIAAGLLAGVTVLFRQDVGGYAVAIDLLMLGAWRRLGRPAGFVPYAVALAGVTIPPALFFLWGVGAAGLWEALVAYPRSVIIAQLTIPFPGLIPDFGVLFSVLGWRMGQVGVAWGQWTDFYVPPLAYASTIVCLARSLWREGPAAAGRRETWALVFLTAIGLALFGYAFYRFDPIHAVATFVPTAVLVTLGLWKALAPRRVGLGAIAAGLVVLWLTFLWVGV